MAVANYVLSDAAVLEARHDTPEEMSERTSELCESDKCNVVVAEECLRYINSVFQFDAVRTASPYVPLGIAAVGKITQYSEARSACPSVKRGPILSISLEFGATVAAKIRSRILYSFRVYAAIYGYTVADERQGAVRFVYGGLAHQDGAFYIPALYREGAAPSGFTKHIVAGESFYLRFGIDQTSGRPDWLGELFLWLSSELEAGIPERDDVGRIPFSATVFSRQGLSPRKPYASLLMMWLEAERRGAPHKPLVAPPSPVADCKHMVICSHDVDYHYTTRQSAFIRLIKNLGIAIRVYQSWPYFTENLRMLLQLLAGRRIGEYIPALIRAGEVGGFRSTLFVVSRRAHRRDPDYELEQIAPLLKLANEQGFSLGLHGSYRSVLQDKSLRQELQRLKDCTGCPVTSGRQHWLRFADVPGLFAEVEEARLIADSSMGFSDMVGFRNGASFAFPPYDFAREAAHSFLEIPLVLMDGNIEAASRTLGIPAEDLVNEVLVASRSTGWGGVAVLWHNPMEPLSVPSEINRLFWNSVKKKAQLAEKWMAVDDFFGMVLPRYRQAGLLKDVSIPADNELRPGLGLPCEAKVVSAK